MIKINHNWINTALIVAVGILVLVGGNQSGVGGGTRFPNGLSADGISPSAGEVRGTTLTITSAVALGGAATLSSTLDVTGNTSVGRLTEGGSVRATTTTVATETLTEAQLISNYVFNYTGSATAAAITVTLPATSTMTTLMPNAGDSSTWVFENDYGAAATTTTIAAGTGIDLQEPDGQNVVIAFTNKAYVSCYRRADTDVVCSVTETIPAD